MNAPARSPWSVEALSGRVDSDQRRPGLDAPRTAAEEEHMGQLDAKHPVGLLGEPDDIAWGIVDLASDEAAFVTGSELVIDGGSTAQ